MCGIAGIAGPGVSVGAGDLVRAMLAELRRRGPDGEGLHAWPDATFGHRRLAIFDLSDAGRQPMVSPDGRVGVVFNGAVYNFKALRSDLEQRGFRFASGTDTEVLVHGYRAWGFPGLLARLRGMFAFALWDADESRLLLARDRLGVKPLVYTVHGRTLAFASSPRALAAAGLAGAIDPQAIVEFLEYGYVTDDRSIYRGVAKVGAGEWIEWTRGRLAVHHYWRVPDVRTGRAPSFDEAVEETERLFKEAVRLRLQADVPVGSLLSGGVDSSLVCWAVAEAGADITAFTVGTPGDPADESSDAVATARALGLRHELIPVSAADPPTLDDLIAAYGEPFGCASALGMLGVSKQVQPAATVLLTGDGGDDVFLGYPEHLHFWRAQQIAGWLPAPAARAWRDLRPIVRALPGSRRPVHFLDYAAGGLGAVVRARDGLPFYERHGMLGERLAGVALPDRQLPLDARAGRRVLADFLEFEHRRRFVGEYMTKVDGATMHHGLEARSPFLDQEIWEFAATLPYATRLRGGRLKAILRAIAERRLSRRVAGGAKRGFSIPVERWLAGPWREAVEERFRDSQLARDGWIRAGAVLDQVRRAAARGRASNHLWYCYVLESWFRQERRAGAPARAGLPAWQAAER